MATQQDNYSSRPSIQYLNDDILLRIFDYLHLDDKIRLKRTCSRWKILLAKQINLVRAIRIGEFYQGGYNITSGLSMVCREHQTRLHRQQTGSLYNNRILTIPADLVTQCFSINQYDYLHRALKYSHNSITMLSLGRLKISYRFLIVITHNLPNLEHLELIGCASDFTNSEKSNRRRRTSLHHQQPQQQRHNRISNNNNDDDDSMPSIEIFNTQRQEASETYSQLLYNQHHDEQRNMEQRLMRSTLIKSCDLVKETKEQNHWPNMKHLLIKDCNLLNEFSLSIILAITSQTLNQLTIESNQYLTGEFLNYCGPRLQILKVKHCPLFQVKFLEDLVKIRQFLSSSNNMGNSDHATNRSSKEEAATATARNNIFTGNDQSSLSYPQPINNSMLRNYRDCNQAIYCTL